MMAINKKLIADAHMNRQDVAADTRIQRRDFEKEMLEKQELLKKAHGKEKQALSQKHGQDLRRIFKECANEHPLLQEARVSRCNKTYEQDRDVYQNVHERMEMYQEVRFKHEWDKNFPNDPYPSRHNEALIEARQKQLLERAKDPKADKVAIHQELEHDQLVLSYMEGKVDHPTFQKEYEVMLKKHMAESTPRNEMEWEHRHPKAPDIDRD